MEAKLVCFPNRMFTDCLAVSELLFTFAVGIGKVQATIFVLQ
jgi:hypothetical protein